LNLLTFGWCFDVYFIFYYSFVVLFFCVIGFLVFHF